MTQSKKIAITGGIGSGKSCVSAILRGKGYPVFSCDEVYATLREEKEYLEGLALLFPEAVSQGKLDKAALSSRVFSNEEDLKKLNDFSHPKIFARVMSLMDREEVSFAEVPLLYEGGYEGMFDGVIALVRDKERRVQTVMRRDGLSRDEVLERIRSQVNESLLFQKGCYVIENSGSLEELEMKTEEALAAFHLPLISV